MWWRWNQIDIIVKDILFHYVKHPSVVSIWVLAKVNKDSSLAHFANYKIDVLYLHVIKTISICWLEVFNLGAVTEEPFGSIIDPSTSLADNDRRVVATRRLGGTFRKQFFQPQPRVVYKVF